MKGFILRVTFHITFEASATIACTIGNLFYQTYRYGNLMGSLLLLCLIASESGHWDNVRTAQPLLLLLTRHCQKLILNRIRLKPRPHCSGNPGRRRLRYSQQYKDSPQFQFPSLHNNSQRNTTIIPHQGTTYSHKMFKNSEPRQSSTSSDKSPRFPQIKGPNPLKSAAVYVPDPRHLFFPIGTTFCLY